MTGQRWGAHWRFIDKSYDAFWSGLEQRVSGGAGAARWPWEVFYLGEDGRRLCVYGENVSPAPQHCNADFCMWSYGRIIISELYLPARQKTIPSVNIGGLGAPPPFSLSRRQKVWLAVINTFIKEYFLNLLLTAASKYPRLGVCGCMAVLTEVTKMLQKLLVWFVCALCLSIGVLCHCFACPCSVFCCFVMAISTRELT